MSTWSREDIRVEIITIVVETRGVDEERCTEEATLFGDLDLESIDFLEVAFRMEESFGVQYPTDDLGVVLESLWSEVKPENLPGLVAELRDKFHVPASADLPGVEPFDRDMLRGAVLDLFTLGALVEFVEQNDPA